MKAMAQSAETDSIQTSFPEDIATKELEEVVIQAPKVIHKADIDVFYPSQSAVEHSKNGMQLARNLMIPTLNVNDVMGTITTGSENVEVRINGRKATLAQVKSLLPENIKRVEWLDNPGLRYKDAAAVLNFIVENPTVGGLLMIESMQGTNSGWGQYDASLKLNKGRSQWGFELQHQMTNHQSSYREYEEQFTYPDLSTLKRTESPTGGTTSYTTSNLEVNYSYIKPDTTIFYASLNGNKMWRDEALYEGLLTLSDGSNDLNLFDRSGNQGFTPGLQAYFEQHFAHNQLLAVDFNASLYNGHTYRTYLENEVGASSYLADVSTDIKDYNQVYSLTADYIKSWKNKRLTTGTTYTANRNRSTYQTPEDEIYHQRQDKVYLFTEYFQRIRQVSITAGIGAQYTTFLFKESNRGTNSWSLRPRLSVDYHPTEDARFTLTLSSQQNVPTLAETNVVAQQNDGFQWTVGNQDLKTSTSYKLTFKYQQTLSRVSWVWGNILYTHPNAIAPYYYWEGEKLITSYENSRGRQYATTYLAPKIDLIPNWLELSGMVVYCAERTRGTDYTHYNHNWSWNATAQLTHWNFSLYANYHKSAKVLKGENIDWDETLSFVIFSYTKNDLEFGVGMINPFNKYDLGARALNKYNTHEMRNHLSRNHIPFLRIGYALQWGHQKRGANKLVDADASVDKSKAGSR